ncbi:MAG TPA: DUF1569 domain-containing protein [Phycisphaerae bacterium]|nr:DUF1569 domain-containing protein [Phycisphaerae bacterium]
MIDTAKVADRRKLRFATVDDCIADVDALLAAECASTLRRLGNWTPGQVFAHLAAWIDYGYAGYPFKRPPLFIRWLIRRKKVGYLRDGMPCGVKIPGMKDGTIGQEMMDTEEGANKLKTALWRLKKGEEARHASPAFGAMSHEERVQLNCGMRNCI